MFLFFASFYLLTIVTKLTSAEIGENLNLIYYNGSSSQCELQNKTQMELCVNNQYDYYCSGYGSGNNSYLECVMVNDNSNCLERFMNNDNITFYCGYQYADLGSFQTPNECFYGLYQNETSSEYENPSFVICYALTPDVVGPVSTTSSTSTSSISTSMYFTTMPYTTEKSGGMTVYGMKFSKKMLKILSIIFLVLIVLALCCIVSCCYSCCKLMFKRKNSNKEQRSQQRCPQSSTYV